MNITQINAEILKLKPQFFQNITIDPESNVLRISDSWNGKIFYQLGHRTNIDELVKYLFEEIMKASNKSKFTILAAMKCLSKVAASSPHFEMSEDSEICIRTIAKLRFDLKNSLTKEKKVFRPNELETKIFSRRKIQIEEKVITKFHLKQMKHYKIAKDQFKLIEKETKLLSFNGSPIENWFYTREYDPDLKKYQKIPFKVYTLNPSQKFLIHATSFHNAIPLCNKFTNFKFSNPNLCVSLIDSKSHFLGSSYLPRVALILSIDPNQLVLTSSYDIWSPIGKESTSFYNLHEKFTLIVNQINQIHHLSGLENEYATIIGLHDVIVQQLEKLKEFFNEKAQKTLDVLMPLYTKMIKKYEALNIPINSHGKFYSREALFQLEQLIQHYKLYSSENASRVEFKKIFLYDGVNILKELQKYQDILFILLEKNKQLHLQKLLTPEEILAATVKNQINEINVKLDTPLTRKTEVKGFIFTKSALDAYARENKPFFADLGGLKKFSQIVTHAKENNLPIYMLDTHLRSKL